MSNIMERSRGDSQRGILLGLAIGDALGAAVEFQMPSTFPNGNEGSA